MVPMEIERIGRRLYADPSYRGRPAWQSFLARGLGLDARSIRRWVAGDTKIDPVTEGLLRAADGVVDVLCMWSQPHGTLIATRMAQALRERASITP